MSDSWQDLPEDSREIEGELEDENMEDEYKDPNAEFIQGIREMELLGLVDIGSLGAWSASSSKAQSGVKELREDNPNTYWQSDGLQPHYIDIHFSKKVNISRIAVFTDFSQDESYTPSKIAVLAGNGFHDLLEVTTIDLREPTGWTNITFEKQTQQIQQTQQQKQHQEQKDCSDSIIRTFLVRILVVANHQHGKDTHLRSIKIYSPMTNTNMDNTVLGAFTSKKLLSEAVIR